jgi:hypothetical protein
MGRVAKPQTDTVRPLFALIKFPIDWRLIPIIPVLSQRSFILNKGDLKYFDVGESKIWSRISPSLLII